MKGHRGTWLRGVALAAMAGTSTVAGQEGLPEAPAAIPHILIVGRAGRAADSARTGSAIGGQSGRGGQSGATVPRDGNVVEQVDRVTRMLALGPSGSLELRNQNGDITVVAGPSREVRIEIVRQSTAGTEADAKLGLDRVQVNVDAVGERASVGTYTTGQGRTPYRVATAYNVTAPAGTRITITSVSGNVSVRNITGNLSAQVARGNIDISGGGRIAEARSVSGNVTLSDIDSDGGLNVGTISGDVLLQRVRARRIDVDVIRGNVMVRDAKADSARLSSLSGGVDYSGELSARGRYELSSHSGQVRFVASGSAGFELQAGTFAGEIKTDPGIVLNAVNRGPRSLRGTVGNGSAIVVLTTFSGNVEIARK